MQYYVLSVAAFFLDNFQRLLLAFPANQSASFLCSGSSFAVGSAGLAVRFCASDAKIRKFSKNVLTGGTTVL